MRWLGSRFGAWLGGWNGGVSAPAVVRIKFWNGVAWVEKPLKVWTGSSWAEKTLKRWNGSQWV